MLKATLVCALAFAAPAPTYTAKQHNAHVAGSYPAWVAVHLTPGGPTLNYQIVSAEENLCNQRARDAATERRPHLACVPVSINVPRR